MNRVKRALPRAGLTLSIAIISLALTIWPAFAGLLSGQVLVPSTIAATSDFANCRFGVGISRNPITTYNYTPTRSGWYVDWGTTSRPPAGVDYYRTLRVKQNQSGGAYLPTYQITPTLDFSATGLGPIVQANPGQVWIIGNEQEREYYQDETLPDMYAQIYHDAYAFIKGIDPTAKIAIGGVIQPTPLRLQYLDLVLAAYRAKYGTSMPVDVWNVHMYILQEVAGSWGASVPVGLTATVGMRYTIPQSLDMGVFSSLIRAMRTWMQSRGYQNTPLIVTEYGVLFPLWLLNGFGLTQTDVNNFINSSANYLNTVTDTDIGFAADGYRLVQQAAIYSLDDDSTDQNGDYSWGSFLFHSAPPYALTLSGAQYEGTMATFPATVDLLPYRAFTSPGTLIVPAGGSISPTLRVLVSNAGNSPPPVSTTVKFWDVTGGGHVTLQPDATLAPFTGCGTYREVSVVWPNLSVGKHTIRIEVDPSNQIIESTKANNVMTATVLVGTYGVYLPSLQR